MASFVTSIVIKPELYLISWLSFGFDFAYLVGKAHIKWFLQFPRASKAVENTIKEIKRRLSSYTKFNHRMYSILALFFSFPFFPAPFFNRLVYK